MKKVALILVMVSVICAGAMIMAMPNNAHAAGVWGYYTVTGTAVSGTSTLVRLTDKGGAFTNRYFVLTATRAKEMLAQALTAMVNNQTVMANTTAYTAGSTVLGFYTLP